MTDDANESVPKTLRERLAQAGTNEEVAEVAAAELLDALDCDLVTIKFFSTGQAPITKYRALAGKRPEGFELEAARGGLLFRNTTLALPLFVHDLTRARLPGDLAAEFSSHDVRSIAIVGIEGTTKLEGYILAACIERYRRWRTEDRTLLEQVSEFVGLRLGRLQSGTGSALSEARSQYTRLARYGNIVVIRTDQNFLVTDVDGNAEQMLGLPSAKVLHNREFWDTVIVPEDRVTLRRKIHKVRLDRSELKEEIRILHQQSHEVRWLMLHALPLFSDERVFVGWEGFGIDITERRVAQEELKSQSRRVEALLEVSRAVQGTTDPAFVALRGLKAVLNATGSTAGYGCFIDRTSGRLALVAAQGLTESYIQGVQEVLKKEETLVHHVIRSKVGLLIDNLQEEPRAATTLAKTEGLRSALIMPLVVDQDVFGAIAIFKREAKRYVPADFELVRAAATQIALALRQAETFDVERRHAQSLRALYQLSHELSKYRSPREIAEHALPILQEEFTLKRAWFGVMNEQNTHLVGKGGFGPGVRRQIQEVQIELNLRHDFLDQAVRTKQAVVVGRDDQMECSGLNRIMQRLQPEKLVLIPLLSLNQVVGMLVVEPEHPKALASEHRIQLLSSMANEIGSVLMARRFEARMADAMKMRMAGLLGAGVAHNFNNLLQAILGQVGLIDIHARGLPAVTEATQTIHEAAKRGANLVSQLLSFSSPGQGAKERTGIRSIVEGSAELYRSLLGRQVNLSFEFRGDDPFVHADRSLVQQVITNILANAKDALSDREDGKVVVSVQEMRLASGEVDPELSPGGYVRIDVRDNGKGMDAEQVGRCFEPFFTTKNVDAGTGVSLGGSGLGLSTAYSIVRQHNGLLTVHSVPGEGSVFSIYLPVAEENAGAAAPPHQAVVPKAQGVILFAIEPSVTPFASSLFSSLGLNVRESKSVDELILLDENAWPFVSIDLDRAGAEIRTTIQRILSETKKGVVALASRLDQWQIESHPRFILLEKPPGVWAVDGALNRLRRVMAASGRGSRKAAAEDSRHAA